MRELRKCTLVVEPDKLPTCLYVSEWQLTIDNHFDPCQTIGTFAFLNIQLSLSLSLQCSSFSLNLITKLSLKLRDRNLPTEGMPAHTEWEVGFN